MTTAESKKDPSDELEALVSAWVARKAEVRLGAARSNKSGYTLALFEPIMVGANVVNELHFRPHTIKDIREHKNDDALTAALCGITEAQLMQLASCDYELCQEVIAGFHLRPAAGGLAQKG